MKSPIRENVNNFKALSTIESLVPQKSTVHSFLFFEGNIEFGLSSRNRFVAAHTNKYVVYEFWKCAIENPRKIAEIAEHLFPIKENTIFQILQESWPKYRDPYVRSALFFLLNRCSDTGQVSSGNLDSKSFNAVSLSRLSNFKAQNFYITLDENDDIEHSIGLVDDADYLFFPVGNYSYNLFEHGKHRGFETTIVNHKKLKKALESNNKKWITLYNYHPQVERLYEGHNITMVDKYGNRTENKERCKELVIVNF